MKATDIRKIREAGFINEAQEHAIVERFKLDREGNHCGHPPASPLQGHE